MKQVLQSLKNGESEVAEVPRPALMAGRVLVRTSRTLVSAGTERMLVEFGKSNLLDKARHQPEKVQQVLEKVRMDGLLPTMEAVRTKLDQPLTLGYCNVGFVHEIGAGVSGLSVGDRVASNGAHAEFVVVPPTLCARIPDVVSDDTAAFTVVGAIALQGVRLIQPTLGECVVVTGLGLIGLLAVQILRANGCRVLGLDYDPARLEMARSMGAETVNLGSADPIAAAQAFSRGRGVDAVLIAASTSSDEPVHQAALMCRQRGRIVLVGVAGLKLSRDDFYKKELTFQVSASYGPGRYDPTYEQQGRDYPFGFVRWTQQRNFEAVLDMMASGQLQVDSMVSHRFGIAEAPEAYATLSSGEPSLGMLIEYPIEQPAREERTVVINESNRTSIKPATGTPIVNFIGAGNYASAVLIPAFKASGATLGTIASMGGVTGLHNARRFGFSKTTTDTSLALRDDANIVVITTRHNDHAGLAMEALEQGKHVFVEKPLCLHTKELDDIEALNAKLQSEGRHPLLMVGFNRRFAPLIQRMKQMLSDITIPKSFIMTVNAGAIPADHWTQDPAVGGGRIIGEGCHFIDLLRFLAGSQIMAHRATYLADTTDSASLQLEFADGSIGTIHYLATGSRQFPKERVEVFVAGRVLQLDNYRVLSGFGWPGFSRDRRWRQDKGQKDCAKAFVQAVASGGASPIPFEELIEVSRATIALGTRS